MSDYDNTNSGAIWKNDKKDTDNHPDFRGSIDVEGVDYWLSGWLRPKDGNPKAPSMKFKITKKEPKQEEQNNDSQEAPQPASAMAEFDDDIPF
jgi:hypothetical protein